MKYLFSVVLLLLLFSCAGTPEAPEPPAARPTPAPVRVVETPKEPEVIEEVITEEPQDFIEIAEFEPEEEQITDDIIVDDAEELIEELAEDDADDYAEELAEDDTLDGFETADLNEQAGEIPSVETAPQITQSSVEQTPPPEPVQPPEPPPRQPPVPPPALLGPAEEMLSSRRETVPPRREPWRDIPAPVTGSEPPIRPVVTPQNDNIVFSRTVRATVGQIVEIPFMGTGWVYMGEIAARRGIVYSSTRRDPEGQSFIFGAEEAGTYALKFFKEDFLRGFILNDYVQVIVGEAPAGGTGWFAPPYDRGRVTAQPRWPSALDAQQREPEQSRSEQSRSVSAEEPRPAQPRVVSPGAPSSVTTEPAAEAAAEKREELDPGVLLQKAGETFEEGNAQAAIALLDQFREYYPSGSDELFWLYGQFYEANTPNRNILLALDYYRRLVNEYPQSGRYNDARRRIAYLERFYINIR